LMSRSEALLSRLAARRAKRSSGAQMAGPLLSCAHCCRGRRFGLKPKSVPQFPVELCHLGSKFYELCRDVELRRDGVNRGAFGDQGVQSLIWNEGGGTATVGLFFDTGAEGPLGVAITIKAKSRWRMAQAKMEEFLHEGRTAPLLAMRLVENHDHSTIWTGQGKSRPSHSAKAVEHHGELVRTGDLGRWPDFYVPV